MSHDRDEGKTIAAVTPSTPVTLPAEAVGRIAGEAATAVRTLFEIWRIREHGSADRTRVDGEIRMLQERARGEIDILRSQGDRDRERGRVLIELVREAQAMMDTLEGDPTSRQAFLAALPQLLEVTLRHG